MIYLLKLSTVLVAISATLCEVFTEEQRKRMTQNHKDCLDETKVNPDLIEKAGLGEFTDDAALKCYTKCFYQKGGFVNDKGEVQKDVVKEKLPPRADKKKALEIIDKCQMTGKDSCETVYLIHVCLYEHTHSHADKKAVLEQKVEEKEQKKKT